FVLLEVHCSDSLIFSRTSRNFILDSVSCVNQQLPHALQPRSSSLRVIRNRTVPGHEGIGSERFHRIEYSYPRDTVPLRHIREFLGKENFAQVCDPILRHKDDAVAPCMGASEIENLNLLAAEVEAHPVTKRRVRQPRPLLLGRGATAYHLIEE